MRSRNNSIYEEMFKQQRNSAPPPIEIEVTYRPPKPEPVVVEVEIPERFICKDCGVTGTAQELWRCVVLKCVTNQYVCKNCVEHHRCKWHMKRLPEVKG